MATTHPSSESSDAEREEIFVAIEGKSTEPAKRGRVVTFTEFFTSHYNDTAMASEKK